MSANKTVNVDKNIIQFIAELANKSTRENALLALNKHKNDKSLGKTLWFSYGITTVLLEEVLSVYPYMTPPTLTAEQANRICMTLSLMQCIAEDPETCVLFIEAEFPQYIYPFLTSKNEAQQFEYLRLSCLGVMGALVKTDKKEVIPFLIKSEFIKNCLDILRDASPLCQIIACFILQKILLSEIGLAYICKTSDRFCDVMEVLNKVVQKLASDPCERLIKYVIRCYLRLADDRKGHEALRSCLPKALQDDTFAAALGTKEPIKKWLHLLLNNLKLDIPSYIDALK